MAAIKSLKIDHKKKKNAKKVSKKRLIIKVPKLERTMNKAKVLIKKSLKVSLKGINKMPNRMYKKIDVKIAKSDEFKSLIDMAVISAVNVILVQKTKKQKKVIVEK